MTNLTRYLKAAVPSTVDGWIAALFFVVVVAMACGAFED